MPHKLTSHEAEALHFLALAYRPDWRQNKPGPTWMKELGSYTFPQAENFHHCVEALIQFATEKSDDGNHAKRTPNPFPREGRHWDSTRPSTRERPGKQPACLDHTEYASWNCPICRDEIRSKHRSPQQQGKRIRQIVPSPGITPEPAHGVA